MNTIDEFYGEQWNLSNTGQFNARPDADSDVPEAWATGYTGNSDLVVAVIDSGIDLNHPDLNIFTNPLEIAGNGIDDDRNGYVDDVHGWDFSSTPPGDADAGPGTELPLSINSHGTQTAGVLGAIANNTIGVSGSAQRVSILPVKIQNDGGFFSTATTIAEAVRYAAGGVADGPGEEVAQWRGADILNNSWSGTSHTALTSAFDWAKASGRSGMGATSFNSSGNGAAGTQAQPGWREQTINLAAAGNYKFEWRFSRDATGSGGQDRTWLAYVQLPNGTIERFDALGMPAGWTTSGNLPWSIEDDPSRSYGTGRYVAKSGAITHNQSTSIFSPTIAVAGAATLTYQVWVSSEQNHDFFNLYSSFNGGPFVNQNLATSGVPTLQGAVESPSYLNSVIAVGASSDWDYRSAYSLYGTALDIVAPSNGGYRRVPTTDRVGSAGVDPSNYDHAYGGTSAAAPLAAGIGVLMLSKNPNLTADEMRTNLTATADKIGGNNGLTAYSNGGTGFNLFYGYGRVNAASVLSTVAPDTVGPRVTKVTVKSADDPLVATPPVATWDVPTGSGEQIRVSPFADIKKISIQFSERVIISKNDLVVRGVMNYPTITTYDVAGSKFYIDYSTNTATWEFANPLPPDRVELLLADNVRDFVSKDAVGGQAAINGNKLDGEFTNPDTVAQTGTSMLPSGNGTPGFSFCFRFVSLPGDADRSQLIDLVDLNTVRNNFAFSASGGVLPQWIFGDMDFNGTVDLPDLNAVRNNFGLSFTAAWPATGCCNCQQMMAQSFDGAAPQVEHGEIALRKALVDAYHAQNTDKGTGRLFQSLLGWDKLGDDNWWNDLLGVNDWKAIKN